MVRESNEKVIKNKNHGHRKTKIPDWQIFSW